MLAVPSMESVIAIDSYLVATLLALALMSGTLKKFLFQLEWRIASLYMHVEQMDPHVGNSQANVRCAVALSDI